MRQHARQHHRLGPRLRRILHRQVVEFVNPPRKTFPERIAPRLPHRVEVVGAERSEHQARVDQITRRLIILAARQAVAVVGLHDHFHVQLGAVAPDFQLKRLTRLPLLKRHRRRHAIAAIRDHRVAAHRIAADLQNHVVIAQHPRSRTVGAQRIHPRATTIVGQAKMAPIGGILQRHKGHARLRKPVVRPVRHVGEKMIYHLGRNKKSRTLQTRYTLKRHAHDLAVLQHRPSAVARIDRRVRLHRQQRPVARMRVSLQLDARHHAARERHLFATCRISRRHHRGLHRRQLPQLQRPHALQPRRIEQLDDRQIAIMPHEHHPRRQQTRVLVASHQNLLRPRDHVRVGQNPPALDHETRARGTPHRKKPPRRVERRHLARHQQLHHRTLRRVDRRLRVAGQNHGRLLDRRLRGLRAQTGRNSTPDH